MVKKPLMAEVQTLNLGRGKKIKARRVTGYEDGVNPNVLHKLVSRDDLIQLGLFLKARHQKIAFTTGTYDMIHPGHVRYLELASRLGDCLVVGLNSDSSVKSYKDPSRPILTETVRAEMLCYLATVHYVTIFPESTGAETIRLLKPDAYLCVIGSWQGDLATKDEVKAVAEYGGKVFYAPPQGAIISTSKIIEKIVQLHKPKIMVELQKAFANGHEKI